MGPIKMLRRGPDGSLMQNSRQRIGFFFLGRVQSRLGSQEQQVRSLAHGGIVAPCSKIRSFGASFVSTAALAPPNSTFVPQFVLLRPTPAPSRSNRGFHGKHSATGSKHASPLLAARCARRAERTHHFACGPFRSCRGRARGAARPQWCRQVDVHPATHARDVPAPSRRAPGALPRAGAAAALRYQAGTWHRFRHHARPSSRAPAGERYRSASPTTCKRQTSSEPRPKTPSTGWA